MSSRVDKILFVKLSAMGDIVHAMPAAMDIKRAFPNAQLHWIVQSNFQDLLAGHPAVGKLIPIPKRPSLSDLWTLRKQLRGERYDVALDMQGLFKSARLLWISGAEKKLGFQWQREGARFFSKAIQTGAKHVVDQYRAVAVALGANSEVTEFGLNPTESSILKVDSLMEQIGTTGRIAINVGSAQIEKQWPRTRFADLITKLQERGKSPFFIGGPMDVGSCDAINQGLQNRIPSLAGKTSLSELVAVLSRSDLHVGGDTGSTHIAVALNKPVACMMGPTDPARSGPYGRPQSVIYEGANGLSSISADDVLKIILNQI